MIYWVSLWEFVRAISKSMGAIYRRINMSMRVFMNAMGDCAFLWESMDV